MDLVALAVWLIEMVAAIWAWLGETIIAIVCPLIDKLCAVMPGWTVPAAATITQWSAAVNAWVPLDIGVGAVVGYYGFLGVMVPIKLAVKLFVPTVG